MRPERIIVGEILGERLYPRDQGIAYAGKSTPFGAPRARLAAGSHRRSKCRSASLSLAS